MVQLSSDCPQFFEFSSLAEQLPEEETPVVTSTDNRKWKKELKREAKSK